MLDYFKIFKAIILREIKIILSSRILSIALTAVPIFSIIFLSTIFGRGIICDIPIGAVDYTNSCNTRHIISLLNSSEKLTLEKRGIFNVKSRKNHLYLSEKEAHKALQNGKIYGYIIIPPDYDKKLYRGEVPKISWIYQKSVLATGEEANGAVLTILNNIQAQYIAERGAAGALTGREIEATLLPFNGMDEPLYNPNLDFVTYITYPFSFIFLQILLIVLVVYIIGMERNNMTELRFGKLEKYAQGRVGLALTAKLLPYLLLFSLYAIIINTIAFGLLNIPINGGISTLLLSSIIFMGSTVAVGTIIALLIPNTAISISIASMYGALGATMCGVTFPLEKMGNAVQLLSHLFPVRYFTEIYQNTLYLQTSHNTGPLLFALLLFIVAGALTAKLGFSRYLKYDGPFSRLSPLYGVALVAIGGTVGYSILYNLIYLPDRVEEVPVATVDLSNSIESRKFTEYLSATEEVKIGYSTDNLKEAESLMKERKIMGIITIPSDFSKRINRGETGRFVTIGTTTSLLYYLAIRNSTVNVMQQLSAEYRSTIIEQLPLEGKLALATAPKIEINGIVLYNRDGGYGSFLMPVVLIVALFQTLIMAIGIYGNREISLYGYRVANLRIISRFTILYSIISLFVIGAVPVLFTLPNLASPLLLFPFILLFIAVTAIFGRVLALPLDDGESINLIVPFFSVGIIFLSGMSFPREAMPPFWQIAHYLLPASPAITGYIKLNSMGAPFSSIQGEIVTLILQAILYGTVLHMCKPHHHFRNGYHTKKRGHLSE